MFIDIKDKVILITGSGYSDTGGNFGFEFAKKLKDLGAIIILNDVSKDKLNLSINKLNHEGLSILADVSNSLDVFNMFQTILKTYSKIDVLINNAGIIPNLSQDYENKKKYYRYKRNPEQFKSLQITSKLSNKEWLRFWDVNVHGVFYCCREALKIMEAQNYGCIVNICSLSAISTSGSFSTPYAATKGAVLAFTKNLAEEVAGSNINVNALALSGVQTDHFKKYFENLPSSEKINLLKDIPLAKVGNYEDYISALLFLIDNKFLTGQVISPNGGQYI